MEYRKWHKAAMRFSTKHSLLISSDVVVQFMGAVPNKCMVYCNGSRYSVSECLGAELITVLVSSQDV